MPDRIQISRRKGWRKPEGATVVSRPTIWGNPWKIGTPGTIDVNLDGARCRIKTVMQISPQNAVWLFADWLRTGKTISGGMPMPNDLTPTGARALRDHLHGRRKLILSEIHHLRGRDLCCWCPPGSPCHADVLLRIANE